jgi:hypothetical protein
MHVHVYTLKAWPYEERYDVNDDALNVRDQWQHCKVVDDQSANGEFPPPTLMMSRPLREWTEGIVPHRPHEEPETMTSSFNSDVLTSVTQCADDTPE